MTISHKRRSTQHKVYIPNTVKENHYFTVNIEVTDNLLAKFSNCIDMSKEKPYQKFYHQLYLYFFEINNDHGLGYTQFIANDKSILVRYGAENMMVQTKEQNILFYDPQHHYGQNSYFNGEILAKNITLLYLPTSENIRENAADFHRQVRDASATFIDKVDVNYQKVKISDHQHLSYDLFSKEKGGESSMAYKLGQLAVRFTEDEDEQLLDSEQYATYQCAYVIADIPINYRIRKNAEIDLNKQNLYQPLYQSIADNLIDSAKNNNQNHGVILAKNLRAIIRENKIETIKETKELLQISMDSSRVDDGFIQEWDADLLVDKVQIIFALTPDDKTSYGYGKHFNQILKTLKSLAEKLNYQYQHEELFIHFHQHVDYALEKSV